MGFFDDIGNAISDAADAVADAVDDVVNAVEEVVTDVVETGRQWDRGRAQRGWRLPV